MNTVFDKGQAERFAELLDEPDGAARRRSDARTEAKLVQLVNLGDKLGGVRVPGPTADFRADLRAQLLATAEREGIGATAADPEADFPAPPRRSPRARIAIIAGIATGTLAVAGISMASGGANPGDPLYAVKRSTEKAQLALAGSDLSRGRLYLELARTRLGEAHAVHGDADTFGGAMNDMDAETADGIRLLTTSAMVHKDAAALNAVDRFVEDQRTLINQLTTLVSTDAQAKVSTSIELLDAVAARSQALRAALTCQAGTNAMTDSLGPLPQPCAGTETTPQPTSTLASGEVADSGPIGEFGRILGDLLAS